jgi:hypothetical protein
VRITDSAELQAMREIRMKQITNKEYDEWQKYKEEKAKGHVLMPDTVRFICEANGYDAYKIGLHFLEILPKITKQHPDNQ